MSTRSINLTERYDRFVEQQIESGRFRDASEVLQAGLRLLEQQSREEKEKRALLRSLATEGFQQLDQGQRIAINGTQQLTKRIGMLGRRAAKK